MADASDDDSLPDLIDPDEAAEDRKPAVVKGADAKQVAAKSPSAEMTLAEKASGSSLAASGAPAVRAGGAFTLEEALRCNEELYAGFTTDLFQRELADLAKKHKEGSMPFLKARQQLFLTVQKEVLPKYGFEGTLNGVFKLMGASQPFINDPEFQEMASKINDVLGVNSPPESWQKLTENLNRKQSAKRSVKQEVLQAEAPEAVSSAPSKFRGHTAAYLPGNMFGHLPSKINGAGLSGLLESKAKLYSAMAPSIESSKDAEFG
mmetsp:Transcript_146870/g.258861  ORF Transcript_146870/g.258861 Transcript_146870/m.258861 type:complete len:263 (+) Transcript_146870:127-915(+)